MKRLVFSVAAIALGVTGASAQDAPSNTTHAPSDIADEARQHIDKTAADLDAAKEIAKSPDKAPAAPSEKSLIDDRDKPERDEATSNEGRKTLVFQGREPSIREEEALIAPAIELSAIANAADRTVRYMTDEEWAAFQAQHGTLAPTVRTVSTPTSPTTASVSASHRSAFQAMDGNANGAISKAEWASWQGLSINYAHQFDGYDSDGDGALSPAEYAASVTD